MDSSGLVVRNTFLEVHDHDRDASDRTASRRSRASSDITDVKQVRSSEERVGDAKIPWKVPLDDVASLQDYPAVSSRRSDGSPMPVRSTSGSNENSPTHSNEEMPVPRGLLLPVTEGWDSRLFEEEDEGADQDLRSRTSSRSASPAPGRSASPGPNEHEPWKRRARVNTADFFNDGPEGAADPTCYPDGVSSSSDMPWGGMAGSPPWYYYGGMPGVPYPYWGYPQQAGGKAGRGCHDPSQAYHGGPQGPFWPGPPYGNFPTLLPRGAGRRRKGGGGAAGAGDIGSQKASAHAGHVEPVPLVDPTTVILRNIPDKYTSAMLIELLDEQGYRGMYDYLYLPMGFIDGVNLGYAFVNLNSHQDALQFTETFHGFSGWCVESEKKGEISWAQPFQGLQAHVERYRNSPVMHPSMPDDYKPMIFKDGRRVAFPPPTKPVKAPKVRVKAATAAAVGSERSRTCDMATQTEEVSDFSCQTDFPSGVRRTPRT
uniref:RRM domain-containing protein n=1 Tax=Noctiluca scintillans TaxID=2966 RepID=A0A7S1A319_NOCSC|mmetsp:Transcript_28865/g.76141  ORF Transcript_28865/g.76141 Transcript_28865/m.76141 type:complete len:485 (+) Transcript_28865:63-1517(+)